MKNVYYLCLLILFPIFLVAQTQQMTPAVYKEWNKIEKKQLSKDGHWASYELTNEAGRSSLYFYNTKSGKEFSFDRASNAMIDSKSSFAAFKVSAHPDTIKALKRRKVKKHKMPKDTLCIFDLKTKQIERVPNVVNFKLSEDYPGSIAFKLAKRTMKQDSSLVKDEGEKNGAVLIIKQVQTNKSKVIPYVKAFQWSEDGGMLALHTTGEDTINVDKVLLYSAATNKISSVLESKGDYKDFTFDKDSRYLAFMASRDTTADKAQRQELMLAQLNKGKAKTIAAYGNSNLPADWYISPHQKPYFLDHSPKLIFGTAPALAEMDSTLLDEEKVEVEVWHYKDDLLYTQQKVNKNNDLKKSYLAAYDIDNGQVIQLADEKSPELRLPKDTKSSYALATNNKNYQKYLSWEGQQYYDVYLINIDTGKKDKLLERVSRQPRLSPDGDFLTWYSRQDTSWYVQETKTKKIKPLTEGGFYNEIHDYPMYPRPSGTLAWSDSKESILYDHYDIWKTDLTGKQEPLRLTKGREENIRYRYVQLDSEVKVLPSDTTIMVSTFDFDDMSAGYAMLHLGNGTVTKLASGPFSYGREVIKAEESDEILFTKESFDLFPNLLLSDLKLTNPKQISKANPQQADYGWGSMKLYDWTDNQGEKRKALLALPPNFDPARKYPLIVNFYEKSSARLHSHRAPYAHRSTINYTYYTNRGYVIFNPDVYYKDGYPGQSCYDAIMTSVDQLLEEGFIDEDNMGLQGHSWGGYQIAHLLTKTNRFKCAESGAPVVNMVSAYGGIRWRTGMSRMFQYERTQSRLGATLWERPDLYLANSPVFQLDKVETPVLILHNDKDGAVPWYQGIEYFVGLRRLGKPAWMLNYNDEPHWPVKKQNRIDFNIRMEQFFDYYLKGEKMPKWMEEGIPAIKKGIEDGLEYSDAP